MYKKVLSLWFPRLFGIVANVQQKTTRSAPLSVGRCTRKCSHFGSQDCLASSPTSNRKRRDLHNCQWADVQESALTLVPKTVWHHHQRPTENDEICTIVSGQMYKKVLSLWFLRLFGI